MGQRGESGLSARMVQRLISSERRVPQMEIQRDYAPRERERRYWQEPSSQKSVHYPTRRKRAHSQGIGSVEYKLIGPVLMKQDLAEARANVRKRIEYIFAELKRLDGTLQDLEDKQNSKREAVLKLQQKIQTVQADKSKS